MMNNEFHLFEKRNEETNEEKIFALKDAAYVSWNTR